MKTLRLVALIFCLFFISNPSSAQSIPAFGESIDTALRETHYEQDSQAQAAILIDHFSSRIEFKRGTKLVTKHRRRIKFYADPSSDWANVEIPFYVDKKKKEVITEIEAYVWVIENGETAKYALNPVEIFTEEKSEHWRAQKFALPKVVKGAVIEYRYKLTSPYYQVFDWDIQQELPVRWAEMQMDLPPFLNYRIKSQKIPGFDIKQVKILKKMRYSGNYNFQDQRHRWVIKDVSAFFEEPYITTPDDYLMKMTFQQGAMEYAREDKGKHWVKFANRVLDSDTEWKNYQKKTGKDRILPFVEHLEGEEKAKRIYELVCRQVTFNGKTSPFPKKDIKELLDDGSGNCTDINIWLCNMLRVAKFEAHPVLLSTRDHGKINESYPFVSDFNFTIVYLEIGNMAYLLDATSTLLPFGFIRPSCMNGKELIMIKDNALWVDLDRGLTGIDRTYINLQLVPEEEEFKARVRHVYDGYDAVIMRDDFFEDSTAFKSDLMDGEAENIRTKNNKDIYKPFEVKYHCEWPVIMTEDHIYFSPFFLTQLEENPFKSKKRSFPIDFNYKRLRSVYITVNIPEGYELEEGLVKSGTNVANGNIQYVVDVVNHGNFSTQLVEKFHVTSSLVDSEHYQEVKDLFDKIAKRSAEQIVLKKK